MIKHIFFTTERLTNTPILNIVDSFFVTFSLSDIIIWGWSFSSLNY